MSAQYSTSYTPNPIRLAVFVVRVADGVALRTPEGYNWGGLQLTSEKELWAAITTHNDTSEAMTIARIPYANLVAYAPSQDGGR